METKEWTHVDRTGWPSGEWDGEPDKVQWQDATGLPCLAVRNGNSGNWCGYVGVAEGHHAFEKDYDEVKCGEDGSPDVHGGLTYANFCQPHDDDEGKGICHVPGPGEPDRVWWLGFDCAHSGDYSPRDKINERDRPESFWMVDPHSRYRTLNYVKRQCESLAKQLSQS